MAFVALRVLKANGRRYFPGEVVEGAENWKHLNSLISGGYIGGYPETTASEEKSPQVNSDLNPDVSDDTNEETNESSNEPTLKELKARAKDAGITGFSRMNKDELTAKLAEVSDGGNSDLDVQREPSEQSD